jgi:hypothetical protein
MSTENAEVIATDECAPAEMTAETKAWFQQRKADQSDLITWILHYKNPADDEVKMRQIRLVIE